MSKIFFFDFETTGFPEWSKPSGDDCQPHIVQLATLVVDEKQNIIQSMDVIVRPEGWEIPKETVEIHGITTGYASDVGISEKLAVEMFLSMWNGNLQVAYNTTFDRRIARIGTKRYFPEDVQLSWKEGVYECAMIASRKIIGGKYPTLAEAYKHFTGKDLVDVHSAMADTKACMEIYFSIKNINKQGEL